MITMTNHTVNRSNRYERERYQACAHVARKAAQMALMRYTLHHRFTCHVDRAARAMRSAYRQQVRRLLAQC